VKEESKEQIPEEDPVILKPILEENKT